MTIADRNATEGKLWPPVWFFFPEILGITLAVLIAPLWCVRLIGRGYLLHGCLVVTVAIAGATGFAWSMLRRKRLLAYIVMLSVLFGFLVLNWSLDPSERFLTGSSRTRSHALVARAGRVSTHRGFSPVSSLARSSRVPPNQRVQRYA